MDTLGKSAVVSAVAIAMAAGGCAITSPPPKASMQFIQVTAHDSAPVFPPRSAGIEDGTIGANAPSIAATCTATNDRGSWTIAAPGRLEIIPSNAPLKITCGAEGYLESSAQLACLTPQARITMGVARATAMMPLFGFIVALPLMGVGAAATQAGDCKYALEDSLQVWLAPSR